MSNLIVKSLFSKNTTKNVSKLVSTTQNFRSLSFLSTTPTTKFMQNYNGNHQIKNLSLKFTNQIQKRLLSTGGSSANDDLHKRIDELVKNDKVVVFMKGTPNAPRCGFSKAVVDILKMHEVPFDAFNVLEDEELRSGIKDYSNWPTIPQIFFKGDFVGGCDILLEMHRSGELVEELEKIGIKSKLADEGEQQGGKNDERK